MARSQINAIQIGVYTDIFVTAKEMSSELCYLSQIIHQIFIKIYFKKLKCILKYTEISMKVKTS